ncbi:family 43 glycosylhydrolase [Niabella beijingensis]|uniref:family 43 glycosylhydrolase n=1 Tax=Niabella beijingensis TaxID=2872700 RepID=UPI001CBC88D5|nr:family 43 glycosylhydrolase [Niabella beijingensis]MBZ4191333.1 family 43 glycosylhydrolase [Niabella beijingensis]
MKRSIIMVYVLGCLVLSNACQKTKEPYYDPIPEKPQEPEAPKGEWSDFTLDSTFSNPVMPGGPDPWVVQKNGTYYYTYTQGSKLVILETKNLSELASARRYEVWTPPAGTSYSKNIWAPELHEIDGKWYFYFAADDGDNANHRMYVLENTSATPVEGNWEFKGKLSDPTDMWAIDGTLLNYQGQRYMIWSGGNAGAAPQNIYIAKMSNPWTIAGEKVMISTPDFAWEKNGNPINEGPQVLINPQGRVYLIYSGSGYWSDGYCLGQLTLQEDGDPMNPGDWSKKVHPVFSMRSEGGVFGPGHNGFFKSPDGKEDWIIYHARSVANQGASGGRSPRIQRFTWNPDGSPNFGLPTSMTTLQKRPSGEPWRYIHSKAKWSIAGVSSEEPVNGRLAPSIIDNNLTTIWITRYSADPTDYPDHWVTVDMGETAAVDGFIISQKDGDRKIKELELLVSNDNNDWESLGLFTLNDVNLLRQFIDLPQRKQFRYFKLVPKSGYDSQKQPGLAEVSTFRFKD